MRDRTIDIGLLREPPAHDAELGFETLLTEPFVAVLPSAHPFVTQRTVRVEQLADCPFVLLPRAVGPPLYDQITSLCTEAGFTPQVVQHAVEWQTVCALVETGLGMSLAPESIRGMRLKGVAFRKIEPNTARARVAVAWRKRVSNPLVPRLVATLDQDPPGRPRQGLSGGSCDWFGPGPLRPSWDGEI
ncbi:MULTISPECIES: LysR family substrate-binding domain-containing protein [unclassified Streptomyces]|uniref:LysR family substrate-binding domain-containing protein n=1 Tax=unclassified Streptomyces TaxID=2593676 RepID=UPI002DD9CF3C|nr:MULTISPECIES: LysR family substrate-binding domain-containing protein [unclassified Streptomyces]